MAHMWPVKPVCVLGITLGNFTFLHSYSMHEPICLIECHHTFIVPNLPMLVVSTGGYFGLTFTTPPPHIEIFGVNALRGKLHHLGSPNLQDIFIGR